MSYCSIEDFRREGFTEEEYPDEVLEELSISASALIERLTGQFFEPRDLTLRFDGRGGNVLPLPVFCIECESVIMNGDVVDPDEYIVYNRYYPDDDRHYPKIYHVRKWLAGVQNIEVTGRFGYVEADGTTPGDIRRACMKLSVNQFPLLSDKTAQEERR